jgi:hypothetical protein
VVKEDELKRIASLLVSNPGKYDLDPTPESYDSIGGNKLAAALDGKGGGLERDKLLRTFKVTA